MLKDGKQMMNMDCFAYMGERKEDDGIIWIENERCFCLITKDCKNCRFYKPRDSVQKHVFYIYQTKIVEWIPK